MSSLTGKQIITIIILQNISRNKDNQTIKLVQLIEVNMKKPKKIQQNVVKKLVPVSFLKSQNLAYPLINSFKICTTEVDDC